MPPRPLPFPRRFEFPFSSALKKRGSQRFFKTTNHQRQTKRCFVVCLNRKGFTTLPGALLSGSLRWRSCLPPSVFVMLNTRLSCVPITLSLPVQLPSMVCADAKTAAKSVIRNKIAFFMACLYFVDFWQSYEKTAIMALRNVVFYLFCGGWLQIKKHPRQTFPRAGDARYEV